jgi:hypothetical protein
MQFARELLCEVVEEVQPLLEKHYAELTLNQDVVKLDPQWERYALLESLGSLVIFTARDGGMLAGYNAFFISHHMHYAALKVAQNDVFYVSEDHRKGSAPLRFLRYCEAQLKADGAHKIVYHCKPSNQFANILIRMGFAGEEAMVGKLL